MVLCCQNVLDECFSGQFGYVDADYLPIGMHLAVMEGNNSRDVVAFCRQHASLSSCVGNRIFACPAKDDIWAKWTATELLYGSVCSSNAPRDLGEYYRCMDNATGLPVCAEYLSWGASSYAVEPYSEKLAERYREFKTGFESCMRNVSSRYCSDEVGSWLDKHLAASYFSQLCVNSSGQISSDCAKTNAEVLEEKSNCETTYNVALLSLSIDGNMATSTCRIVRDYATCVMNAVARRCGLAQAKAEEPEIRERRSLLIAATGCTLDGIAISGSRPTFELGCLSSKRCEPVADGFCSVLPYNRTAFPNLFGHPDRNAAMAALTQVLAPIAEPGCSARLPCFLCSLHLPVCSDLKGPILPCRRMCTQVLQSCGASLAAAIQCDSLPDDGLCLDASQCSQYDVPTPPSLPWTTENASRQYTEKSSYETPSREPTFPNLPWTTEDTSRQYTKNSSNKTLSRKTVIIASITSVTLAAVLLVIIVIIIRRPCSHRKIPNPIYGQQAVDPMTAGDSNAALYMELDDILDAPI